MFGLMRAKTCGMSAEEKRFRRLHYCGTCKTIGSLYGQKSRFLLNHDTVFLAEFLSSLSDEKVQNWQNAYQSYNCLSLPKTEMPLPLQFAATANLVLTEFKLADKIADENSLAGKIAQKNFSNNFQKARKQLEKWQFPFEKVREILSAQETIESEALKSNENPDEILNDLARPTAETTAVFFSEGVRLIGRNELENAAFEIGFAFGKLIYLLDAFEDYEKDFRREQFNAIRAAFRLEETNISAETKRKITAILSGLESEIIEKLYELPIAESKKEIFAVRLRQNLARKSEIKLPVLQGKVCRTKPKVSLKERFAKAKLKANELTANYSWAKALPIFLFIMVFATVAPAQTREAKSARECFDLGFNLMFLGAMLGAVLTFPKKIWMENPEELLTKEGRKKKLGNAASDGLNDGGAAEGCCDACECCCCDCDGCGCDGCDGCCCECDGCGCDGCDCGS
jgi:hypothetical protein